jgi:hypothetical protein
MAANERLFLEEKSVDGEDVRNTTTLLFASDNPPAFPQSNRAIGRRLYPVEFPMQYVPNPDPSNRYELQAEPKGEVEEKLQKDEARQKAALIRGVEGLIRLTEVGEPSSDKEWPERLQMYNGYADPIADFARHCLQRKSGATIHTHDLQECYSRFADAKGHPGKQMSTIVKQIDKSTSLSMKRSQTRTFTDGDSRDVIYEDIAFTSKALESFVPKDGNWAAGQYAEHADTDGDGDDDLLDPGTEVMINSTGNAVYEAVDILSIVEGSTVALSDAREAAGRVTDDVQKWFDALDDAGVIAVKESVEQVKIADIDRVQPDDDEKNREDITDYDDDGDGEGGSDTTQQERTDAVLQVIEQINTENPDAAGAPAGDVIEELDARGIDESAAEQQIESMMFDGEVYEPQSGFLKTTVGVNGGDAQ